MDYLLDTHAFLWFINGDTSLSGKARQAIEDTDAVKTISIASFWEIAVKLSIGKLTIEMPFHGLQEQALFQGFSILPVSFEHTAKVSGMTFHHRDPFDRLIIAQAMIEGMTLITSDDHFKQYDVELLW